MATNVPQIQFLPTGLSVPTEAAVLAGVQADISAAYGVALNFADSTPQGQLASSLAAAISGAYATFAQIVNGENPDTATSFMQDGVGRIYYLNRNPGVATVVQCTCVGAVGTVIPTGAQAQDTSGNLYQCTQGGTIGSSGNISLTFANIQIGAIACPAGTLTIIYQAVPGWESITNAAPGVVGAAIETATAFEFRRRNSVAGNAQGFLASVYGAVFSVPNVIDAFCYENDTSSVVTYGSTNFSLAKNSIYVGVIGGDPVAIAQAIYSKKSPGCNYNGNTTETITDTSGNYSTPPTYQISLNNNSQNPANVYFSVVLPNLSTLPSNITTLVQNAIVNQFTGAQGSPRARIASTIAASDYTASVQQCAGSQTFVQVLSIAIGTAFSGQGTLVNGSTTLTVTTATSGLLTFGTQVSGTGVASGAYIVQQLSGALSPPTNGALTQTAGGSLSATTYYVRSTWTTAAGETLAGAETSLAVSASNVLNVAAPGSAPVGATGWNVYVSTATGTETKQNASPIALATAWVEPTSGLIAGSALPATNTSGSTGGTGTYQMSVAATATEATPETITGVTGQSATFGIDQAPTTATGNITVTLQ